MFDQAESDLSSIYCLIYQSTLDQSIIYHYIQLSTIIYHYLQLSTIIYHYLQLSTIIYHYLQLCTAVSDDFSNVDHGVAAQDCQGG
jgi:hypothetical protein